MEGTLHSQINAESTYSITISTVKSLQELCHVNHMSNMNPIVMKFFRNQVCYGLIHLRINEFLVVGLLKAY